MCCVQVIITDLGEIGENAIIVFEENVGVGAEEIVANQEYVTYTGDSEEVLEVKINNNIRPTSQPIIFWSSLTVSIYNVAEFYNYYYYEG